MTGIQHDTSTGYTADLAIGAPAESVFAAISTVRGLGRWWTPDTSGSAGPGGELRFAFAGHGIAMMRVEDLAAPALVRWACLRHSGLPEWAQTEVTFRLTAVSPAATRLEFTHAGLRPGLDCYRLCSAGWDHYLASLAAYAETGAGQPFGSPAVARP
jgi:uncharacterized protein YndB with AHSA1/START domain